jgi:hypothetical protein
MALCAVTMLASARPASSDAAVSHAKLLIVSEKEMAA